jgi:hypothetical protein
MSRSSISGTITVSIVDDTFVADHEDFSVVLSNISGPGMFLKNTGTCLILNDDGYDISINDVTVNESDGTITFTVSKDSTGFWSIDVDYTTVNGSATEPGDYTAINGTLTIPGFSLSRTITVPIISDTVVEADETFTVVLSNVSGPGWLLDDTGVGTITNDDSYEISINDPTANEDFGPAVFTVSVDQVGEVDVSVDYVTADGSATQPGDYAATSGTLTIPAGSISGTFSVPVVADTVVEANETFTVGLSNIVTNGLGAFFKDTGTATITNDDVYGISIDDVSQDEDSGNAIFTVTLDQPGDVAVSVDYATADGSAVHPGDYVDTSGTLTIAAGGTNGTITVPIVTDTVVEGDETYNVGLSNIVTTGLGAFIKSTGFGTITNDDQFGITVNDSAAPEGTAVTFEITLGVDSEIPLTVTYAASDGTATLADNDYMDLPGSVAFPANSLAGDKVTFTVSTIADLKVENDETFGVTVSSVDANYDGNDATGTGTITNDDRFNVSVNNNSASEGAPVTFTVTLNTDSDVLVDVTYDASDGTATLADSDYTDAPGTVTFAAGSVVGATQTFTVATTADTKVEADEDFSVLVSSLHPYYDGNDATGTGTITNDDQFNISVNNSSASEGTPVTFTVTLNTDSDVLVDVTYDASDGTATLADSDYTDAPGTVTFAAGSVVGATQTFTVATTGDTKVEADEDFSVLVSSLHPYYDGNDATGTGTITNDDRFNVSVNNNSAIEGTPVTFTVTLNTDSDVLFDVTYDASDGTATLADSDYTDAPGTVTFAAGSVVGATQTFTVATTGDTKVEDDEDFSVLISSLHPYFDGNDATGTGTITNDDQFGISVDNNSAVEGAPVTFTVTLNNQTDIALDVTFDASDGTATVLDSDYTDTPGFVTFAAGSLAGATQTFTVATLGDTKVEADEDFSVLVSSLHAAYDGIDATGTGTITNNDQFGIAVNNSSAPEGTAVTFEVTLGVDSEIPVTVTYAASDGTATLADNDYMDLPGSVAFPANSLAGDKVTFTVSTVSDLKIENDETFGVTSMPPEPARSATMTSSVSPR